jgi:acetyl esterase/lipase
MTVGGVAGILFSASLALMSACALAQAAQPVSPGQETPAWPAVRSRLDLPYAASDNPRQRLDLYWPRTPQREGPLPLIVFIHGGAFLYGDRKPDPQPGDPCGIRLMLALVASGRYAGASLGYRLSAEATWPAQIHDCKAAIRWLRANARQYGIDPGRIGVMGTSAGGHLAAVLGTSGGVAEMDGGLGCCLGESSRVTCVVDEYGPTDFLELHGCGNRSPDTPAAKLIGGPLPDHPKAARSASPMTYVASDNPPFLVIHGTKDGVVSIRQSERLVAALQSKGVDVAFVPVPGGGHGGFRAQEIPDRIAAFFDRCLR